MHVEYHALSNQMAWLVIGFLLIIGIGVGEWREANFAAQIKQCQDENKVCFKHWLLTQDKRQVLEELLRSYPENWSVAIREQQRCDAIQDACIRKVQE
jgi:hypothetical protein